MMMPEYSLHFLVRICFISITCLLPGAQRLAAQGTGSGDKKGFALVELFTSEGCSSCPPADKLLSELMNEKGPDGQQVIALAYHVDYWNRLGWKDPYSKYAYTIRQENYSRVLPEKEMYTPEMVVNGRVSFTGSNAEKARSAISTAFHTAAGTHLSFTLDSVSRDSAYIRYRIDRQNRNVVLQVAFTQSGLVSHVLRGENSGKELRHDRVVRVFYSFNQPTLHDHIAVPLSGFKPDPDTRVVLFLQNKLDQAILAVDEKKIQTK